MEREFKAFSSEIKYENPWFRVVEMKIETDGKSGVYNVVERPEAAMVIVETDSKEILFVHSYRYTTGLYSWELPCGGIEKNESPAAGAKRELKEEAGIQTELERIGEFYPALGLTSQRCHIFYGKVSKEEIENAKKLSKYDDEIVEFHFFNVSEIKEMIQNGILTDGFTLCSLAVYFSRLPLC